MTSWVQVRLLVSHRDVIWEHWEGGDVACAGFAGLSQIRMGLSLTPYSIVCGDSFFKVMNSG